MNKLRSLSGPGGVVAGIAFVLGLALLGLYATGHLAPDAGSTDPATPDMAAIEKAPTPAPAEAPSSPATEAPEEDEAATSDAAPSPAPEAPVVADDAAVTEALPEAEAAPVDAAPGPVVEDAAPDPVAPEIDIVRVDPEGGAVIAGQATPNAVLRLFIDGVEAAVTEADAGGSFVFLLDLGTSDVARVLSLSADGAEGAVLAEADVILAPSPQIATETAPEIAALEAPAETGGAPEAAPEMGAAPEAAVPPDATPDNTA